MFFWSFLISVAFQWCRHVVKIYCQGCDLSRLADDKTATSCEGQTAHGGKRLHLGGEGLLSAPSSPQEVSSLYPCLVAFARPDSGTADGGTAVGGIKHGRYLVCYYLPQAARCCLESQSCCTHAGGASPIPVRAVASCALSQEWPQSHMGCTPAPLASHAAGYMSTLLVSTRACSPLADALPMTHGKAHHQGPFVHNWARTLL